MKRTLILLALFATIACDQDQLQQRSDLTLQEILGDREYSVYKGMLTFRDKEAFNIVTNEVYQMDERAFTAWEKERGFKSMRSLYEKAILAEDNFLEKMLLRYGENPDITRAQIGYSEFTNDLLRSGALRIAEDDIYEMNLPFEKLGSIVNEDRLVRVGNEIWRYAYDQKKKILNADYSLIATLDHFVQSSSAVIVSEIHHNRVSKTSGRVQQLVGTCTDTEGNYRVIGYEDMTYTNEGGTPCPPTTWDYFITLRSLRKILGTWQNYQTSAMHFGITATIQHLRCDNSVYATPYSISNGNYYTPGGQIYHTYQWFLIENYDTGPCVDGTGCTGSLYILYNPGVDIHRVQASGYNGTTCYVTNWP